MQFALQMSGADRVEAAADEHATIRAFDEHEFGPHAIQQLPQMPRRRRGQVADAEDVRGGRHGYDVLILQVTGTDLGKQKFSFSSALHSSVRMLLSDCFTRSTAMASPASAFESWGLPRRVSSGGCSLNVTQTQRPTTFHIDWEPHRIEGRIRIFNVVSGAAIIVDPR
jgi:soluble cytochrome b562